MRRLPLAAVYFLLVTPYGLAQRLLGRSLAHRRDPAAASYLVDVRAAAGSRRGGTR